MLEATTWKMEGTLEPMQLQQSPPSPRHRCQVNASPDWSHLKACLLSSSHILLFALHQHQLSTGSWAVPVFIHSLLVTPSYRSKSVLPCHLLSRSLGCWTSSPRQTHSDLRTPPLHLCRRQRISTFGQHPLVNTLTSPQCFTPQLPCWP